ncbi:MAG: GNAT family N-acetyltransferase [Bacteroidetes bacterium GWD2_45_23]|nr:MAG: GNAT family N-acetyltransferase [Bacteroidetes bacterium GWC2_46_850]OFX75525.1 MAG: GNAT family N-acetyltransferase [Bacteroidetes bacterium GWC1_47_7]OFX82998.1 MAG: GNAT family N-acetyltransferase [Bacteroidetes bacterium GWD2_45_23]HAR37736.1 GNAT family N-acetyltransferase [Porphyromonadaceae bacterium]HBA99853.1 GNAT family N-acetyltransferase [Porphyromonadaceae bacterium]
MVHTIIFDEENKPDEQEKKMLVDFLHDQLEQYGDPKNQIERAIDYSLREFDSFGGFVMLLKQKERIRAAVVINRTGMDGYIPENILVYIAVDRSSRGEGLGRKLMTQAIAHAEGDIALHVEANNPATKLYEKLGFTNPYLEMRLKKGRNG